MAISVFYYGESRFYSRYTDDELFIGPQDDGLPQWLMEACSAISVFAPENPNIGTRSEP